MQIKWFIMDIRGRGHALPQSIKEVNECSISLIQTHHVKVVRIG
jgi:hypothetical protein